MGSRDDGIGMVGDLGIPHVFRGYWRATPVSALAMELRISCINPSICLNADTDRRTHTHTYSVLLIVRSTLSKTCRDCGQNITAGGLAPFGVSIYICKHKDDQTRFFLIYAGPAHKRFKSCRKQGHRENIWLKSIQHETSKKGLFLVIWPSCCFSNDHHLSFVFYCYITILEWRKVF